MQNLPTELHLQILAFCNECDLEDGGKTTPGTTVRAFRSVCKYFAAIAQSSLYHTVCVRSISQAEQLYQRLEQGNNSGVRNLFLTDGTHSSNDVSIRSSGTSSAPKTPSKRPQSLSRAPSMSSATLTTLTRLLTLCAPSLQVLFIAITSSSSPTLLARVFRMRFPELLHHSISGLYPFPNTPNTFPRLRTLRLYGNPNPSGLLSMGALESSCPELRHLEVGGLKATSCFKAEVEQAVWNGMLEKLDQADPTREASDEEDMFPPKLPTRLQAVTIQQLAEANDTLSVDTEVRQAPPPMPRTTHGVHFTMLSPAPSPSVDQHCSSWIAASARGGW